MAKPSLHSPQTVTLKLQRATELMDLTRCRSTAQTQQFSL